LTQAAVIGDFSSMPRKLIFPIHVLSLAVLTVRLGGGGMTETKAGSRLKMAKFGKIRMANIANVNHEFQQLPLKL
jgi:hypothetical protein